MSKNEPFIQKSKSTHLSSLTIFYRFNIHTFIPKRPAGGGRAHGRTRPRNIPLAMTMKNDGRRFYEYEAPQRAPLKLRVSLIGYTVTTATCYVMTMTITWNEIGSTMTGHLFNTIIVALTDKEWWYRSINCKYWKLLETVGSHLNMFIFVSKI